MKKALLIDKTGVEEAVKKEKGKLLDSKTVFKEDHVVDRDDLIARANGVGLKTRKPPIIRFSKILLKLYKKGVELPLHMQKWSVAGSLEGVCRSGCPQWRAAAGSTRVAIHGVWWTL